MGIINKNVLSKDKNLSSYASIKTLKSQASSVAPWRGSHELVTSYNNPNFEYYIGNDGLMHSGRKQGPLIPQEQIEQKYQYKRRSTSGIKTIQSNVSPQTAMYGVGGRRATTSNMNEKRRSINETTKRLRTKEDLQILKRVVFNKRNQQKEQFDKKKLILSQTVSFFQQAHHPLASQQQQKSVDENVNLIDAKTQQKEEQEEQAEVSRLRLTVPPPTSEEIGSDGINTFDQIHKPKFTAQNQEGDQSQIKSNDTTSKPLYFNFQEKDKKSQRTLSKVSRGVKSPHNTQQHRERVRKLSRIRSGIKSLDYPWNDAINKPYPVFKVTSPNSASQKLFHSRYGQQNLKKPDTVNTPSPPQSPEEMKYRQYNQQIIRGDDNTTFYPGESQIYLAPKNQTH